MKVLTKIFAIGFCLCIFVSLSSCKTDDREFVSDYDEGYFVGYEDGLWDGAFECKKDFANAVRDKYSDLEHATLNGRDLHPEEAIMVLNDYLDGEYVSDDELETAIKSITDFYYDWQSVIADIEDLDVDIDFDDEYIWLD